MTTRGSLLSARRLTRVAAPMLVAALALGACSDDEPAGNSAAAAKSGPQPKTVDAAKEAAAAGEFQRMATLPASVDAIFNGHTHQVYAWDAPKPGGGTRPILQTGEYAANVGQVQLTVESEHVDRQQEQHADRLGRRRPRGHPELPALRHAQGRRELVERRAGGGQ